MVIEFAGKELFDYIVQKGRMAENEARRFFQQIISAVEYCHKHKIVHRDLKPENLLLDDNQNVKIADFGLSNIMTDGNFLKTSCGSPNYAAPEVISGKLYAGPEVDVWSCGVILYVMLCGRLPFDDEFIPNLFKKISGGVYTIPSDLSPGSKHLLRRMLVVNPLNRITVHEIMEDPWFKKDIDPSLLPPDLQTEQEKSDEPIDENLVSALERTMGYSKEQIQDALRHPKGEGSEIRDAYQLLKDNRLLGDNAVRTGEIDRYLIQDSSTEDNERRQHFQQNNSPGLKPTGSHHPPALTFDPMHGPSLMMDHANAKAPQSTIAILPTSLPAYHRASMIAYGSPNMRKLNPVPNKKKGKTRWHFGIRSRSYPLDVMCEIYRALKNLGAEWATPTEDDLWTIQVRWKCPQPEEEDSGTPKKEDENLKMKMRIQLYQIEQNNYLVDFKFDGWESSSKQSTGAMPPFTQVNPTNPNKPTEFSVTDASGQPIVPGITGINIDSNSATSKTANPQFDTYSAFPFLHLATRLIMELAVNSQNA